MRSKDNAPAGKLAAAGVEVAGGRLARVRVSGGFFLEPDDAIDRLSAALTGIPAAADASGITARTTAVLGDDDLPAGITAGAVATAARRALARVP